jgi:anti-anti-sigma factor
LGAARWSSRRSADGSLVIEIRGELDSATSTLLRDTIVGLISRERPVNVIVDLLHVTFIDSTGLGALIAAHASARSHGIGFTVRNPAPFVRHQMHVTGLYDHLTAPGT